MFLTLSKDVLGQEKNYPSHAAFCQVNLCAESTQVFDQIQYFFSCGCEAVENSLERLNPTVAALCERRFFLEMNKIPAVIDRRYSSACIIGTFFPGLAN